MKKLYLLLFISIAVFCLKTNAQTSCDVFFTATVSGDTVTCSAYHSDSLASGTYTWDYGNGGTATGQNPTYIYPTSGTYVVYCYFSSSTDSTCTPSYSDTIVIGTCTLTATTTSTNASCVGCTDGSATVTASGGLSPYTYYWNTGATSATIGNLAAGTYTATVTDANGCSYSASAVITEPITQQCDVFFSSTTSGGTVTFNAYHTDSLTGSYSWDFGDGGTASVQNPIYTYSTSGTYTVYVYFTSSTDTSCTPFYSDTVSINTCSLTATITSTNATCVGCTDGSASVTASGGLSPYTYYWNTGATSATIGNLAAGTYTATVTDANGCSYSASTVITEPINQQCDVYFNSTVSGGTVTFNAYHSDSLASGIYSWTFGDGGTASVQNPTYTYSTSGTYTVFVYFTSSTDSTCTPSFSDTVSVSIAPSYDLVGLVYTDTSIMDQNFVTVYKKDSVLFYIYADTIVSGGEFNISGLPQGNYLVKVAPTPSSAFYGEFLPTYYGDSTSWTGATEINLTANFYAEIYLVKFNVTDTTWNKGNDIISGTILQDTTGFGRSATNPVRNTTVNMRNSSGDLLTSTLTDVNGVFTIRNVAAGDYMLSVDYPGYAMQPITINSDGDSATSTTINFDLNQNGSIVTSILYSQNKITIGSVTVYPNPASEIVTISAPYFNSTPVQVKITSFSGSVVYNEQLRLSNEEVKLNTSKWPNGMYFITVSNEKGINTKKLIIKH